MLWADSPTELFHEQLHIPLSRLKCSNEGKPCIIRERRGSTQDHGQRARMIGRCGLDRMLYIRAMVFHGLAWRFQLPDPTGEESVDSINIDLLMRRHVLGWLTLPARADPLRARSEVPGI